MSVNEDAFNHAIGRWNAGDLDGYLQIYDPTIRLHGYSPEPMNKTGVTEFYKVIFSALPEAGQSRPKLDILDLIEAEDRIACRFAMSGTHSGTFLNVPATGRPYVLPGITILKFANGRVVERWSNADMLGLLVQLGAAQAPA